MGARPLRKMGFGHGTHTGGSHAPTPSDPRPPEGPPPRRRTPAGPPPVQDLQAQDLGPGPLVAPVGRRRPDHYIMKPRPLAVCPEELRAIRRASGLCPS